MTSSHNHKIKLGSILVFLLAVREERIKQIFTKNSIENNVIKKLEKPDTGIRNLGGYNYSLL